MIAAASLMLSLLCVFLAFVAGVANGLLVLATVFAAVYMWAVGVFSREYWDEAVIEVRERTER